MNWALKGVIELEALAKYAKELLANNDFKAARGAIDEIYFKAKDLDKTARDSDMGGS